MHAARVSPSHYRHGGRMRREGGVRARARKLVRQARHRNSGRPRRTDGRQLEVQCFSARAFEPQSHNRLLTFTDSGAEPHRIRSFLPRCDLRRGSSRAPLHLRAAAGRRAVDPVRGAFLLRRPDLSGARADWRIHRADLSRGAPAADISRACGLRRSGRRRRFRAAATTLKMSSRESGAPVRSAPCMLFAYHEMGYACMEALLEMDAPIAALFTHRNAPGEEIWWRSCAELAHAHSIPIHAPEVLDADWIARIAAMRPAVIYSFNYRNLLPDDVLRLAPLGTYNVHGALLPKYRGRAPVNWMIINGEREGGVTLHHMVARADAGDIVGQRAVEISDEDTALSLYRKIVPLGVELIREFHPMIVTHRAPRRPQNLAAGSYFGRRRPEDGRIDWRWPARRIFNLVRAVTHPYPGAFCWLNRRKLFVWESRIAAEAGRRGAPGEIVSTAGGALEVAAGEGSLLITRAQLDGAPEGVAAEVLSEILSEVSHGAGSRGGARLE